MAFLMRPRSLKRYRDIARLLIGYGRAHDADPAEAEAFVHQLEALGPTFIKLGQLLSTRGDLLPPVYIEALSRLQDGVAPFSFSEVEETFEAELGVRLSKAFKEVEAEPVAAASMAQVHKAWMRDGRIVALKVQRPGLRETVTADMEVFAEIASFVADHSATARRVRLEEVFEQFRRVVLKELDFKNEARNLVVIGENLAEFDRILVPHPIEGFTTERILTMEYAKGRKVTCLGPLAHLELDGEELADQIFRAYLKQVLVDGVFHADPHPGNVLLTEDARLALLDLGMVGRITPNLQARLLKLMMAVAGGLSDEAASIGIEIGQPDDEFDESSYTQQVLEVIAEASDRDLRQIEVGRTLVDVTRIAARNGLRLPAELSMVARALLNLDQVALVLDPGFNPNAAVRRHAPELIQQKLSGDLSPSHLLSTMVEVRDFVQLLPGRLNRILEAVADNDIRVQVRAFDERHVLSELHRIANRVTMGLVMSALIVGAALLMRVDTPYRILGYPALAIVCFLLASGGGLVLLWAIHRDGA